MALIIRSSKKLLTQGNHPTITINESDNRILMMVSLINTGVSGGTNGTTYAVSYKHTDSDIWIPLETFPESGIQVTGTISPTNVDKLGSMNIGYVNAGDTPLVGGLTYRIEISNDNGSGDTELNVWMTGNRETIVSSPVIDSPIVMNSSPYSVVSQNTTVEQYTFTGYPDIASMGVVIADLPNDDPDFPDTEVNFAMVRVTNGITSNGSNVADVESISLIGRLAENGTDLDINNFISANIKGRAGQANDSEDQSLHIVKLRDGKFVWGLNTVEESGSNAFGNIFVIGYIR